MEPSTALRGQSAPRRLALAKETLRRLTPAALRLAAGGVIRPSHNPTACRAGDTPSATPLYC